MGRFRRDRSTTTSAPANQTQTTAAHEAFWSALRAGNLREANELLGTDPELALKTAYDTKITLLRITILNLLESHQFKAAQDMMTAQRQMLPDVIYDEYAGQIRAAQDTLIDQRIESIQPAHEVAPKNDQSDDEKREEEEDDFVWIADDSAVNLQELQRVLASGRLLPLTDAQRLKLSAISKITGFPLSEAPMSSAVQAFLLPLITVGLMPLPAAAAAAAARPSTDLTSS